MTRFSRSGHWRTNANGTTFWVSEHQVHRDHWDVESLKAFAASSSTYIAADFLRRSNVGRGQQGCYVNPNARCPVCNVPVFYYANSYGSRVFFDDLGPPWPKHPCTDRPTNPVMHSSESYVPIKVRGRGVVIDLIQA